ncbi:MAG: glycosyltransferase family A protein [Hyphomicrobiales bacterium]|nr:glycosyltransferase family A protein [Hyphomicrobiales bacterium]
MTLAYSVVIPAYNAAATIDESIASILAQTVPAQEIVVVDDGSTDGTASVVSRIKGPITVISQENRGPGSATSAGLRHVTTPLVATLDADDVWLPAKIARQIAALDMDPGTSGIFSLAKLFADGASPDPHAEGPVRRLWTRTTLLFRTDAAREVGDMADLPGNLGEVIDWLARSRDLGHRHAMVEEVLAMRRIRAGSLSSKLDAERARGYLAAVRNSIDRKKARAEKSSTEPNC